MILWFRDMYVTKGDNQVLSCKQEYKRSNQIEDMVIILRHTQEMCYSAVGDSQGREAWVFTENYSRVWLSKHVHTRTHTPQPVY